MSEDHPTATTPPVSVGDNPTVGFVGLGAMGWHMAANLADAFEDVRVHNRTGEVATRHAGEHWTVVAALEEIAAVDILVTCLPTSAVVAEVAEVVRPGLRPGAVWIDMTSGDPAAARDLADRLAEGGVAHLDAPVSGGTNGAEAATLTIMVGGAAQVLAEVRHVLEAMGSRIVHVGEVGTGHAVKAINNTLLAANLAAAVEGLLALRGLGIDPTAALEVVNHASGRSFATEHPVPERIVSGTFDNTFTLGLLAKDTGIGVSVLDAAGDEGRILRAVAALFSEARDALGGDGDHSEVAKFLEIRAKRALST